MKRPKSMLAPFLSLLLLLSSLPCTAFAMDDEVVPLEESFLQIEEDEDTAPIETTGSDTPSAAPTEIKNLEELLVSIETAESGDTIILQHQINISENCVIGDMEKHITFVPAENFDGTALLCIMEYEEQDIFIQNLTLDGLNTPNISAILANSYTFEGMKGTFQLSNTEIKNFDSSQSNVWIYALDTTITACSFCNNTAVRTAGIEISPNTVADISDCLFSGNVSYGDGGALRCRGQVLISNSVIQENRAADNGVSPRVGGGICVDAGAFCEATDCQITNNTASLGGGIAITGKSVIVDSFLCHNQGISGASDVRAIAVAQLTVTYSDGMNAIYTDDTPIGFYADDFENPFDPESNAVFLGESLIGEIPNNQFGARFIFAADLPEKEPEDTDEIEIPSEPAPPEESEDDIQYYPTRPSHPTHSDNRPVVQAEESTSHTLSVGSATLDTANPIVLYGYGDGELHESDPITRAQIAVLLYRALNEDSKTALSNSTNTFSDMDVGAWYYDAVSALASVGIVKGYDGIFDPDGVLTLGQFLTILTRFVEPKTAPMPTIPYTEHWAYDSIVTAYAYGWIDSPVDIKPERSITRGEAVEFINSIFEKCR